MVWCYCLLVRLVIVMTYCVLSTDNSGVVLTEFSTVLVLKLSNLKLDEYCHLTVHDLDVVK
jgi:hypothetical protein